MVRPSLARLTAIHSLTWLVAANGVGVLLAVLLLVPQLGELLAPLTYGRWVPVHLGLQLFGWCSLPLVGLLLHAYCPSPLGSHWAGVALGAWSASLLVGALSWLAGGSSGKLFLEWSGTARWTLFGAQVCLLLVLVRGFVRSRRDAVTRRWPRRGLGLLLVALATIPPLLLWSSGPQVYPPINPDSGGATGSSLLGSTLGIVALLIGLPFLLGLRLEGRNRGRGTRLAVIALVLHGGWFTVLDHGDQSHHAMVQTISLASLAIWLPLLRNHLRRFVWPAASRPWLAALGTWGLLLVITGVLAFLPGVLERWKFTNALVAHAHIAMAGLVSALDVLVLQALLRWPTAGGPSGAVRPDPFAKRLPFALWHGGNGLGALALLALGTLEGSDPSLLFRQSLTAQMLYLLRLAGGLAMMAASATWLSSMLDRAPHTGPRTTPTEVAV